MTRLVRLAGTFAALGFWVLIAAQASAQQAEAGIPWGTIDAPGAPAIAAAAPSSPAACSPAAGACAPALGPIPGAALASGGCGLRNRGDCGIDISNARGPAQFAALIWSVILGGGVTDPSDRRVSSIGLAHNGTSVMIRGGLIGSGLSPCWGGGPMAVYYGVVPLSIINNPSSPSSANGHYGIVVTPGGSGSTTGDDPWSGSIVYPLFEGAGLIVIGTGSGTVYGWGGPPFSGFAVIGGRVDYLLGIPQVPTANAVANLLSIVADGQIGFSAYTADRRLALKSTTINGVIVAGAGSATLPNSILNGDLAAPSPRLFDVALIDIGSVGMFATSSAVPGFPAAMAIRMDAKNDCLTLIAHVLEIH